jgi:hypothetical protein
MKKIKLKLLWKYLLHLQTWGGEIFDFEVLGSEEKITEILDPYFPDFIRHVIDEKIFGESEYPATLLKGVDKNTHSC